jgi:hypothetical protein
MRIGVTLPQTEITADPVAIRDYAQAAEDLGYTHLLAYDHVLGADTTHRPGCVCHAHQAGAVSWLSRYADRRRSDAAVSKTSTGYDAIADNTKGRTAQRGAPLGRLAGRVHCTSCQQRRRGWWQRRTA